ncbi:MAG: VanZ family protein [Ideonella sp.]|nr:VanZ family protein [Ideonella sp.]MCC7456915.1 hypothetical protein [Nitrospira sp.]
MAASVLALWPHAEPGPPWFSHADKAKHALGFALLAAVGLRAGYRSLALLAIGLALFGGAIEIAQGLFTTTRSAEWLDWAADVAGIALGLGAWIAWRALGTSGVRSGGLEQEHRR